MRALRHLVDRLVAPEISRAVILVLVGVTPLLITPGITLDDFVVPKLAALLAVVLSLVGLAAARALTSRRPTNILPAVAPVLYVTVPLVVAWIAGPYKQWSVFGEYYRYQGLIPYLLVGALALIVADLFHGDVAPLAKALVAGASVVSLYALVQALGLDPVMWDLTATEPGSSTIGNSTFTGGFLAICLPVAVGVARTAGGRRWAAMVVLIAAGGAATMSEGAWAAAVAGVAVAIGVAMPRGSKRLAASAVGVLIAAGTAVLLPVAAPLVSPSLADTVGPSAASRAHFWQAAADMTLESPVLGRGPNAFAVEGVQTRPRQSALVDPYRFSTDPHSLFWAVATSAGLFGIVGLLGLLLWTVRRGVVLVRAPESNPIAYGLLGGAAAYWVQSLVSIDDLSIRIAFWSVVGALAAATVPRRGRAEPSASDATSATGIARNVAAAAIVIIAVAVAAWSSASFLAADVRARKAHRAFGSGDILGGTEEFSSALDFRHAYQYREDFGFYLADAAVEAGGEGGALWRQANAQLAYLDHFPDLLPIVRLARANLARRDVDSTALLEAEMLYRKALRLDPWNPLLGVEASDVLIAGGRAADALRLLGRYRPLPDDYPRYWGALALANSLERNYEVATVLARRALRIDAEDPRAELAIRIVEERDGR